MDWDGYQVTIRKEGILLLSYKDADFLKLMNFIFSWFCNTGLKLHIMHLFADVSFF